MGNAKKGDKVKVHYTGKFDDGTVFDSSEGRDPLEFTLGSGQVIPGFENGVVDMELKESKTVNIPADEAYGIHREDMVIEVKKEQIPQDIDVQLGTELGMSGEAPGQELRVTVVGITDDMVKLDGNHPMAGKDLTFDITLEEIA